MGAMATDDPDEKLLTETKKLVRSLLIPEPKGMPTRELNSDYKEQTGHWLPHKQLKFQNADALLQSMTDILWYTHDPQTGRLVYNVKEVGEDAHVRKLVVGQKKDSHRAKVRKRASALATRGRGGYRGRGGRGRGRGRGRGGPLLASFRAPQLHYQQSSFRAPQLHYQQSSLLPTPQAPRIPLLPTPKYLHSTHYASAFTGQNATSVSSGRKVNYDKTTKAITVTKANSPIFKEKGPVPKLPSALRVLKETSNTFSIKSLETNNHSGVSRPRSPIPSSVKSNVLQILKTQRGWIYVEQFCSLYEQKFKIRPDFRNLGYSNINEVLDILADVVERQVDPKGNIYIRYLQTVKNEQESPKHSTVSEVSTNISAQITRDPAIHTKQKISRGIKSLAKDYPNGLRLELIHPLYKKKTNEILDLSVLGYTSILDFVRAQECIFQLNKAVNGDLYVTPVKGFEDKEIVSEKTFAPRTTLKEVGHKSSSEIKNKQCISSHATQNYLSLVNIKSENTQNHLSPVHNSTVKTVQTNKVFNPKSVTPQTPLVSPQDRKSFSPIYAPGHTPEKKSFSPIYAPRHTPEKKSLSPINAPGYTPEKKSFSPIFTPGHTSKEVGHKKSSDMKDKQCISSHATQNLSLVNVKSENSPNQLSPVHNLPMKTSQIDNMLKQTTIKPSKRTNFPFINQQRTTVQYDNTANSFPNYHQFSSIKTETQPSMHIKMETTIENEKIQVPGNQEKYQQMDMLSVQDEEGWVQIYISEIYNPHNFYCHVKKNEQALIILMDEMTKFYHKPNNLDSYRLLEIDCVVNMPVVILFEMDHVYRGIIKRVNGIDSVEIFYVDYGIYKVVQLSKLGYIHRHFFSLPVQVFKARLCGISPAFPKHHWHKKASERFIQMVIDKPLFAKIKGIENSAWSLDLVDTTGKFDVNIKEKLVRENWALHDGQDEPLPVLDSSVESSHNISKASLNSYNEEILKNECREDLYENQKLQEQYLRQEMLKQEMLKQKLLQERQDKILCQKILQQQKNISNQKIEQDLSKDFSCLNVMESQRGNINGFQPERRLQEVEKSQRSQSPNLLIQVQNNHYKQENLGENINLHKQDSNNDADFKSLKETNFILRKHIGQKFKEICKQNNLAKSLNISAGNISDGIVGATNKNEQVAHVKMHNTNDPPFTLDQLMMIKEAQSQQNKLTANRFNVGSMNARPLSPSYDAAVNGLNNYGVLSNNEKITYCIRTIEKKRDEIIQQLQANPESDDLILDIKEKNKKIRNLRKLLEI